LFNAVDNRLGHIPGGWWDLPLDSISMPPTRSTPISGPLHLRAFRVIGFSAMQPARELTA